MYKKAIAILIFLYFCFSGTFSDVHASEKFRFVVMGCMHFGACDSKDYELAVEKIKECKPDFVLFLGGMIDPSGEKSLESVWQEFERITAKLEVPVYDIPSDTNIICNPMHAPPPSDRAALMEKCFLDRYKARYYSFEHKNNLFIGLDSNNSSDLFEGEQLNFLKKAIADVSKYDNIFISIHHSPPFQDWWDRWHKVIHPLIKGKVKYVFGAHEHFLNVTRADNITYITSGCPPLYPNYPIRPYFFHFLIVDVSKNKVSIKIVPLNPIPIEEMENYGGSPEELLKFFKAQYVPTAVKVDTLSLPEREAILQPNRVIETLKIKPGMKILDIGAGTGFFTFRFADALEGTGKVYATDTNSRMVDYIKKKTEEGEYKNIFPVIVQPGGVDPFYKQHSFDIIFMSQVYPCLMHPEDYLRELRPSLKKTGRLYIIHAKNVSDFSEFDFGDFKKVTKVLISIGEDFPVFRRLSKEVQYFIKNWQGEDIPSAIKIMLIQDFNMMLSDRLLYNDFWERGLTNTSYVRDVQLAVWLIVQLDENGVFDKKEKALTEIEKKQLSQLNKILLTGLFQMNRLDSLRGETFNILVIAVEKSSIISTMEKAGYQFVREYDFLNYHYFLEFKRKP